MANRRKKTRIPNVFIHENGTYYFRKGALEKSLGTKNEAEARLLAKDVASRFDNSLIKTYRTSVADAVVWYLDDREKEVESGNLRASTFKEIKAVFDNHLLPFFGHMKFARIDEGVWDEYVSRKSDLDLRNHRKYFGRFLNKWAKRKKLIRHPIDLSIPLKEVRKRKILSPDMISKLLENSDGSLQLFICFYLFMGMRRKEIITLGWKLIDLDHGFLIIPAEYSKTRKERAIPISRFIKKLLDVRKKEIGKSPWVFPHRDDRSRHADLGGLKRAWTKCLLDAELELIGIQPHDMRATQQYYSHNSPEFTDKQREAFSGSSAEIQRKVYANQLEVEDMRGLEDVVRFKGLKGLQNKILAAKGGKIAGNSKPKKQAQTKQQKGNPE